MAARHRIDSDPGHHEMPAEIQAGEDFGPAWPVNDLSPMAARK